MRWPPARGGAGGGLKRWIIVWGLGVAVIAGCGGGAASKPKPGGPFAAPRVTVPRPVSPALVRLRAALTRELQAAGPGSGGFVYDIGADEPLFALRARVMRPPASVEKLYTTVALLDRLGPDARLHTVVLGSGHLGPRGVWHGDLYLRGGGDPTFGDGTFNRVWEQGYGPTATELVQQLSGRGIRRVTGAVIGDDSRFDSHPGGPASGFAPDISDIGGQLGALSYDHGSTDGAPSPGVFATRELVLSLRAAGVSARAAPGTGVPLAGARVLASVRSPRMSVLLRLMNVRSDDFFAEMLTKELGARFEGDGSTAAGIKVIGSAIASHGVHPRLVDGSGLSRANRSSPVQVVGLLRAVHGTASGDVLGASLPLVGVYGTARHIGVGTAAQGNCIAKTGTLDGVTNLGGYCHARGRRLLAFALFIDGPSNERGILLLGRLVAAIARY